MSSRMIYACNVSTAGHIALSGTVLRSALVSQGVVHPLARLMLGGRSASAAADSILAADTGAWALSHVLTDGSEVSLNLCCLHAGFRNNAFFQLQKLQK